MIFYLSFSIIVHFLFFFFSFFGFFFSFSFSFYFIFSLGQLSPLQECRSCPGSIGIAELFRLSSFDPYPPGVLLVAFRVVSGGSPRVTEQENIVHIVPVRPVFRPRILSGVNRSSVYAFRIGIRCSRRRFLRN